MDLKSRHWLERSISAQKL